MVSIVSFSSVSALSLTEVMMNTRRCQQELCANLGRILPSLNERQSSTSPGKGAKLCGLDPKAAADHFEGEAAQNLLGSVEGNQQAFRLYLARSFSSNVSCMRSTFAMIYVAGDPIVELRVEDFKFTQDLLGSGFDTIKRPVHQKRRNHLYNASVGRIVE